jgi:TonB family protein
MARRAAFLSRFLLMAALALGPLPARAQAGTPRAAEPEQALPTLFSDTDYPAAALRNHEEGAVGFRLSVGPDGAPAGCSVTRSSGSTSLDSTTCRLLMERARFRPGRDAKGRPIGDSFEGRIVWRLGESRPTRLQTVRMLWTSCVMGEAAKLVPGDLTPAQIADRAFPPCERLEALVAEAGGSALPADRRAALRTWIESSVVQTREALGAPAGPAERR